MRTEVTVRCIGIGGVGCGASVDPERGGAWCRRHRPLDLTGGVLPWEGLGASERKTGDGTVRRVTDEELAAWREMASDGITLVAIGRQFGRHHNVVQAALREASTARRYGPADYARWAACYRAGATSYEISRDEGLSSPALVRHHLRRLGVPLRGRGRRVGMN